LVAGCTTSAGVIVATSAAKGNYHSAYVVVHADRSSDMDALLDKEMLRHGLEVSNGPKGSTTGDAQLMLGTPTTGDGI
jgi:hypothetical protein